MRKHFLPTIVYCVLFSALLAGCGAPDINNLNAAVTSSASTSTTSNSSNDISDAPSPGSSTPKKGSRDNTPNCLVPVIDGTNTDGNELAVVDYSGVADGYISVNYLGTNPKVKLRITGPDQIVYTYDLDSTLKDYETFPLTAGNGSYEVSLYENVSGTSYSTAFFTTIAAEITNEFGPYLYPNQYVNFNKDSVAVSKAKELVEPANTDLDAVTYIYDFITSTITYDTVFAESNPTGYVSTVDNVLASKKGICLDYAALMSAMLRSQQIPTRLEVGYAQDAYHAWISIYLKEKGWLNGIIEITDSTWNLVDPTFGASTDDKTLKKFIGDGTNYTLEKIY